MLTRLKNIPLRHHLRPRSFGRFLVTGGVNTLIGLGSFPFFYWLLHDRYSNNTLLVLSWTASTSFAFFLHKHVTFKSQGQAHREGVKFLILSLIILGINLVVMNMAKGLSDAHPVLLQFTTSLVLTVGLMVLNFFGMGRLVFKTATPEDSIKN